MRSIFILWNIYINSKLWRNILDDIIQVDNLSHFSEKRSHSNSLLAAIRMNGMIAKPHVHHRGANLMDKIWWCKWYHIVLLIMINYYSYLNRSYNYVFWLIFTVRSRSVNLSLMVIKVGKVSTIFYFYSVINSKLLLCARVC